MSDPMDPIITRHDDGTYTATNAGPVIRVSLEFLEGPLSEPWVWDGVTLQLDTAGEHRYRLMGPDPDTSAVYRVALFERIET